jgi:hypothetical protein
MVGCAKSMNDRGEQFRVWVVRSVYHSVSVQFDQLGRDAASLSIFSSQRVGLRTGLHDFTVERMRFGGRNGILAQRDAAKDTRQSV